MWRTDHINPDLTSKRCLNVEELKLWTNKSWHVNLKKILLSNFESSGIPISICMQLLFFGYCFVINIFFVYYIVINIIFRMLKIMLLFHSHYFLFILIYYRDLKKIMFYLLCTVIFLCYVAHNSSNQPSIFFSIITRPHSKIEGATVYGKLGLLWSILIINNVYANDNKLLHLINKCLLKFVKNSDHFIAIYTCIGMSSFLVICSCVLVYVFISSYMYIFNNIL